MSDTATTYPPDAIRTVNPDSGPLRAVIEAYLFSHGFYKYETHGSALPVYYWGHREVGGGRTFEQMLTWQLGVEYEASR